MILRRTCRILLCGALLLATNGGCAKNACERARDRLLACQMPEGTFNFDGDCVGERQRAMECIAAASCDELRRGGLVRCLEGGRGR